MKKVAVTQVDKNEFFSDEKELITQYYIGRTHRHDRRRDHLIYPSQNSLLNTLCHPEDITRRIRINIICGSFQIMENF